MQINQFDKDNHLKSSLNHWAELYQTKIAPFMTNIDFFSK